MRPSPLRHEHNTSMTSQTPQLSMQGRAINANQSVISNGLYLPFPQSQIYKNQSHNPSLPFTYNKYAAPPNTHIPTPTHHTTFKFTLSKGCFPSPLWSRLICLALMLSGVSYCVCSPRFTLAPAVAVGAASVGFIVTVGSI